MSAIQTANRLLLPALGLAVPAALPLAFSLSPAAGLWTLGACAAVHGTLAYATLRPNNAVFGPVVTRFAPTGDEVWLTIDDGPDPHDTPRLLDLLDAQPGGGSRATFFLRGDRARAHPALVRGNRPARTRRRQPHAQPSAGGVLVPGAAPAGARDRRVQRRFARDHRP